MGDSLAFAGEAIESGVDIGCHISVIGAGRELPLPGRTGDRDRTCPVLHGKTAGNAEFQPQIWVEKVIALDHPLLGIITIQDTIQALQKLVTIANAPGPRQFARDCRGARHSAGWIRMGAGPFGRTPGIAPRRTGINCGLRSE